MDIKTIALNFKNELEGHPTEEKVNDIAMEIQKLHLTDVEIEHILNYIKYPIYDHTTGKAVLHEGNNQNFLKLITLLSSKIKRK